MLNDIQIISYVQLNSDDVQLNLNDMLCLTITNDIQDDMSFMFYIAIFNEFEFRMNQRRIAR